MYYPKLKKIRAGWFFKSLARKYYAPIVIGAHGSDWKRASRRFLVGNVADAVSKRAPIPVIVVR